MIIDKMNNHIYISNNKIIFLQITFCNVRTSCQCSKILPRVNIEPPNVVKPNGLSIASNKIYSNNCYEKDR